MNALNRLAAIASELDEHGLYKAADVVTDVMQRISRQTPQEVIAMAPSMNTVGQYDESAWRQAFSDKYQRFTQMVQTARDDKTPMNTVNPTLARGLYDEMMYIASNYLKNDPEIFNIMKWVVPTYKGVFGDDAA